jgi:hypothetical protein
MFHHDVVTKGMLSTTQARELYGHFGLKMQMNNLMGPYWLQDSLDTVKEEAKRLKMIIDDPVTRLNHLCTDKIDEPNGQEGKPFLTILAALLAKTYNTTTGDVGLILEDVWDVSILNSFTTPHL